MESTAAGTALCPSCGQPTPADAGFCPGCGRVLSAVVYAGFWMRFLANFLDGLILIIPNIILATAAGDALTGFVLQVALNIAYVIGFWSAKGATPGKMVMGIQITTVDGEPIGSGRAILRYIGYFVSWITLGIGFLIIAFNREKRGLHDYIAGTVVVKTR